MISVKGRENISDFDLGEERERERERERYLRGEGRIFRF